MEGYKNLKLEILNSKEDLKKRTEENVLLY
jgi:hypothetical protein